MSKKAGRVLNNRLLPINISGTDALNSIGENIIIAIKTKKLFAKTVAFLILLLRL